MAKEKAKEFLEYLLAHPEAAAKMKGFTMEEIKEAMDELKKDGKMAAPTGGDPHTTY